MSIEWKKGEPSSRTLEIESPGKWLLIDRERGYYALVEGPPEEGAPAPSPREGAEGSEGEGGGKGVRPWTPGPWGVDPEHGGSVLVFADRTGGNDARGMIAWCDAGNYARSAEEGRANARLIKEAPNLYEALDELVNNIHSVATYEEALDRADAILARARGEGS